MPILQLTAIEQVILILLSVLLSITILFLLITYKKYALQSQHGWRDVEKDFVMIQGTDHMLAIKRSESSSLEAGRRLTTQALIHQPILTLSNDSNSTLCPKSPPPVYYEVQTNN